MQVGLFRVVIALHQGKSPSVSSRGNFDLFVQLFSEGQIVVISANHS